MHCHFVLPSFSRVTQFSPPDQSHPNILIQVSSDLGHCPSSSGPLIAFKVGCRPWSALWQGGDPLMRAAWRNALLVRLPEHFNAEVNTGVVPIPQYLSLAPKLQRLLFHRVIYLRAALALLRSGCWHSARRDPHRSFHTQIFELWWLQMTWLHSQSIYDAINYCCQQQDDNFHCIFPP